MTALIAIEGLAVDRGGVPVLRHADLTLERGDRLALLGANGSGKSTLLQAMVGLLPLRAGRITAFGRPCVGEADFRQLRRKAGLVFQDPDDQLFCPTVVEDVMFGPLNLGLRPAAARQHALETLAQLGLEALADRVTWQLSGGEKRLVSVATVLAMQPEALLLDEPTTGLDAEATDRLCAILEGLPQAMVLVSHDAAFLARLATRGILLKDGRTHQGHLHVHPHQHAHAHFHFEGEPHHG